jgi:serine/threonine protein kinase
VQNRNDSETLRKICPICGKPVAGNRRLGSLTAFLFGASDCSCSRAGGGPKASRASSAEPANDDSEFCPKCGLEIVRDARDGSLTGFLFQSTRCKCPADKAFADGQMSARFWQLKQTGSGTVFISSAIEDEKFNRSSTSSIDLAPGAIIGGAYKIFELIGRGGMGEVYLARHETLGKKCALKVIPPEQVTEIGWQRFQLEARAVARLEHINLVRVTDLGIHEGCLPFYAMDYVEGKNLADLLAESGPMPLAFVLDIFLQVCDGVDCAHHHGILHRDLKPANIMVQKTKPGQSVAKVLDFGLAKLTKHDRHKQSLTAAGDVFGSPFYMSPEQCKGDKLDRRSDIYSLGCTMFECLTGRPPFAGHLAAGVIFSQLEADPPSLESVVGKGRLPDSMEIVIAKLLRKNPVERHQSLLELRGDLEKVARGEEVQPFYVSRSKNSQDAVGVTSSAAALAEVEPAGQTIAFNWRVLIVVATALTLLLGLWSAKLLQKTPSVKSSSRPEVSSKASNQSLALPIERQLNLQSPPASAQDIKPYSSIIVQNGKDCRVFDFPNDILIGILKIDNGTNARRLLARGRCIVPLGVRLYFTAKPDFLKYPNYVKRFRPGDLFGVFIGGAITDDLMDDKLPEITDYLKTLSAVPGVQALNLDFGGNEVSAADLALLERYPFLRQLLIQRASGLDIKAFSKLSILRKLESLDIEMAGDLTPILKSIRNLSHLNRLVLRSDISLSQLALVAGLPGLQTLHLFRVIPKNNDSAIDSAIAALNILSKAPKLQDLQISELPGSVNEVSVLKSFKSLKTLRLDFRYGDPELRARLENALRGRIKIIWTRNDR